MQQASVVLIPIPIADNALNTLSPSITQHILHIRHYMVENIRTARRFLKAIYPSIIIDDLHFSEIDKHHGPDLGLFKDWLKAGHAIGVMSESGCPGIADPGAALTAVAQEKNIPVVPLTGPNSLILALMASGLNGQSFAFNGYLPVKEPARGQRIKELESRSKKEQQTQLFIETPYRNNQILDDLLKHCHPQTRICIAIHITAPDQSIRTQTAAEWKKQQPQLEKVPAVFLFLA